MYPLDNWMSKVSLRPGSPLSATSIIFPPWSQPVWRNSEQTHRDCPPPGGRRREPCDSSHHACPRNRTRIDELPRSLYGCQQPHGERRHPERTEPPVRRSDRLVPKKRCPDLRSAETLPSASRTSRFVMDG